jgi:hypothetical protein
LSKAAGRLKRLLHSPHAVLFLSTGPPTVLRDDSRLQRLAWKGEVGDRKIEEQSPERAGALVCGAVDAACSMLSPSHCRDAATSQAEEGMSSNSDINVWWVEREREMANSRGRDRRTIKGSREKRELSWRHAPLLLVDVMEEGMFRLLLGWLSQQQRADTCKLDARLATLLTAARR